MNIFNKIKTWLSDSPIVILIFLSSLAMLGIGLQHFREDIYSTLAGIKVIESVYHIKPVTWALTYYTMAISFTIGQIILLYVYLVDTSHNFKAILMYSFLFLCDTVTDVYYRSNGFRFTDLGGTLIAGSIFYSVMITLVFYTLFSEVFLTMGFTLSVQLLAPAIIQLKKVKRDLSIAFHSFKKQINAPPRQNGFTAAHNTNLADRHQKRYLAETRRTDYLPDQHDSRMPNPTPPHFRDRR